MVDFNGSACVGIVLQLLLEHARLVVRNKGMWPASHTAVYDVRLCMVPVRLAAWTWTLLRGISIFILGWTSFSGVLRLTLD
jgi:hypothetical protein